MHSSLGHIWYTTYVAIWHFFSPLLRNGIRRVWTRKEYDNRLKNCMQCILQFKPLIELNGENRFQPIYFADQICINTQFCQPNVLSGGKIRVVYASRILFLSVSYIRVHQPSALCINMILFYFSLYWITKMFWLRSLRIRKSENEEKRNRVEPEQSSIEDLVGTCTVCVCFAFLSLIRLSIHRTGLIILKLSFLFNSTDIFPALNHFNSIHMKISRFFRRECRIDIRTHWHSAF